MTARASRHAFVGRTLGEFVVREKIGEGGFGAVYRATQLLLDREAVVKILHTYNRADEAATQRFLREARLASRLDHPYAAHIYAFGAENDGTLWIAMELVRGTPLDQLLRIQGPLPVERFVSLLDRICEVVHTAHEQGIVHRDLKPANVMVLARAGRLLPKLLDFGIAKVLDVPGNMARAPTAPTLPTIDDGGSAALDRTIEGSGSGSAAASAPGPGLASGSQGSTLTRRGAIVGSPLYMAPEQWADPAAVDARTDIYALGVLAFEALTGGVPFSGPTVHAIAFAHAEHEVPSLGPRFSPDLDRVLARAMAKRPADRFASVLELASAFRQASGVAAERPSLPQLDESLRQSLLSAAPQPLAEAVAALEAARNLHHARDGLFGVVRVVARTLGLLAMACRGRLGQEADALSPPVAEALRSLHRGGLPDEGWAELARELCRPFVTRRDAYPLPELVSLFFEPSGEEPAAGARRLDALFALHGELYDGSGTLDEPRLRALLGRGLEELGGLLRSAAFLSDYPLVVGRAGEAEHWMGVRRTPRATLPVRGPRLVDGEPVLVDRAGCPVLSLHPLVQVAPPAPGAQGELFLFEGRGRRGALLRALPHGFERSDEQLWDWFRGQLLASLSEAESVASPERPPYRGLASFTPEDAGLFFGRERAAEAFVNRLQLHALLTVVGPSGAGKSSFIQAGVVPALPSGWQAVTIRPGPAPMSTLGVRLAQLDPTVGGLWESLAAHPDAIGAALRQMGARSGRLVLVVDQFEELFTLCRDPAEQRLFAEGLARAARSAEDPVRVVLTLRDDFLVRAEQLEPLRERLALGLQLLTTPAREDLLRILVEPARRRGYDFEDRALPEEMVTEVAERPGALALLSFTAAKLWELRDRHFKRLTRKAYQALGGVGGALAQHAESTLAAMVPEEQRLVREAFRHLVTAEGTRAVLTGSELRQILGGGPHADTVIERLVAGRLLTVSESEQGGDRIEIVHEALLEAWPRLVEWRREDAGGARLRDQLRSAARQWDERGRPPGLLWRDDPLSEYQRWRLRHPGPLSAAEEAFAGASLAEAARGRRIRTLLVATAFAVLAAGIGVLLRLNQRVQASAQAAQGRLAMLHEEQGRLLLLGGDPPRALVYLAEAFQQRRDSAALRLMIGQAVRATDARLATLTGHGASLYAVGWSPDGSQLVTASEDRTARVWDASGRVLRTLAGHSDIVYMAAFSPDGARILTGSGDRTARLWDARTGATLGVLGGHRDRLRQARFDRGGRRVLTTSNTDPARVWDGTTGAPLLVLADEPKAHSAAFDPEGARIATGGQDGLARIFEARTGRLIFVLGERGPAVAQVEWSPDGRRLLAARADGRCQTFDAATGRPLISFGERSKQPNVAWSPDGKRVVAAADYRTVRVWDAHSGALALSLEASAPQVWVTYSPDGSRILTTGRDGSTTLWLASTGKPLYSFVGHQAVVWMAAFAPDGRRFATAGFDGQGGIWDASAAGEVVALESHAAPRIMGATFTTDDRRLATAIEDGTVQLWDAQTGRLLEQPRLGDGQQGFVAPSPDATRVVIVAAGQAHIWQIAPERLVATLRAPGLDPQAATWRRDGEQVVTMNRDGSAAVWNARDGALVRTFRAPEGGALWASLSPRGDRLLTTHVDGNAGTAEVWDLATGRPLVRLAGDLPGVMGAEFSADGTRIVVARQDKIVTLWDARTGRLVASLDGHANEVAAATFSPDGELVATGSWDGTVKIWEAANGRMVASFASHAPWSLAFSHDGRRVAAVGVDRVALIWDVSRDPRTPDEIARLVRCRVPFQLAGERLLPTPLAACGGDGATRAR